MKKRILLPTSFFFSVLFTVFLFGLMIGIIGLSVWKFSHLDSNRDDDFKPIQQSPRAEAIVEVAEVLDGDTIRIKLNEELEQKLNPQLKEKLKEERLKNEENRKGIGVRIHGIDAPEDKYYSPQKSFYAPEAKEFVEDKINNKTIKITWDNHKKGENLGRLLAYVYTQDDKGEYSIFLNKLMLEEGYAWVYSRFKDVASHPQQEVFQNCEAQAKENHKGVWNTENKIKWGKAQGIIPNEEYNTYVIIGNYFHREWCKEVDREKHSYNKEYKRNRENIAKNKIPCSICNP